MKLGGVIVPLVTPLTDEHEFDAAAHRRLVGWLLEAGVDAIFANGSMGGFALLPDAIQVRAVEATAEVLAGRLPLLAGVSDTGTLRVKQRLQAMRHLPVDYFVALPPFFYAAGQRELLRFYQEVADAAARPLVLYNNPHRVANQLEPATVAELAQHPNIAGIKESSTEVAQWRGLLEAGVDRSRFALICGAGRMTGAALAMGFDGITEGLHNVVPQLAVALYRAARAGDRAAAAEWQSKINRAFRIFELDGGWRGVEAAFAHLGIRTHLALPPYDLPMDPAHVREIRQVLVEVGVLAT